MTDQMCAQLGLRQPNDGGGHEHLGTVDFPDGSWVEVAAVSGPLRYWHLQVYCKENDRVCRVETGDGPLEQYWPTVELIADGMVSVIVEIDSLKAEVDAAMNEPPLPAEQQLSLYRTVARRLRHIEGGEGLRKQALMLALEARNKLREQHPET